MVAICAVVVMVEGNAVVARRSSCTVQNRNILFVDGGKRPCGSRREGAGEVSGFAYLKLCVVCGKIKTQI